MDELLSEKEQWEWLKGQLRENGPWIVAGVAIAALGIGAWRWWEARQDRLGVEASQKYEEIIAAFGRGDRTQALSLIGELEREHADSPYVDQAHLAEARINVDSGQLDKAVVGLKGVMEGSKDEDLALVARLRLARVQLAQNKLSEALATLNGATDSGAFAPRYSEVRGDIYYAQGDKTAALKEYRAARAGVGSSVDSQLLDLKINDLTAGAPAAASTSAPDQVE